jgi:hypothetical protein
MTNGRSFSRVVAALAVLFCATAAHGQMVQAPARPGQPPTPTGTRTSQTLTATTTVLGGFDDSIGNLSPGHQLGSGVAAPKQPSYTGVGNAGLRYVRGTESRSIMATGNGYFAAYQHLNSSSVYGGDVAANAQSSLGRRMTVSVGQSFRNEPLVGLSGMSTSPSGSISSAVFNPAGGVASARSWALNTSALLRREWTRRTRTDLSYSFAEQRFKDRSRFNTSAQHVRLGFDRSFGRSLGVATNYGYVDQNHTLPDGTRQSRANHSLSGQFRAEIARSRQRVTAVSVGGGVNRSEGIDPLTKNPYESWSPSADVSVDVGFGRTWSLNGGYQHTISTHPGVQPVSYIGHSAHISAGGFLNRRLETVFTASHTRSHNDPVPQGALNGTRISYDGTAQLRFAINSQFSTVLIYSHHQYWLDATASRTSGIYNEMHRNSIRIGVSWSAPIIGTRRPRGGA